MERLEEHQLYFEGSTEEDPLSVDDRRRIRVPDDFYGVIIARTNSLPLSIKTQKPETYTALTTDGRAVLIDRKVIYAIKKVPDVKLDDREETIDIDFGTIKRGSRRVKLPIGINLEKVVLRASQKGEFLYILDNKT